MALHLDINPDDDSYRELVRSVGFREETHRRERKQEQELLTRLVNRVGKSRENKDKSTKSEGTKNTSRRKDDKRRDSSKQSKSHQKNESSDGKTQKSKSTKYDTPYRDRKEYLKGISEKVISARREKNRCLRCGDDGHAWFKCTKPIVVSSTNQSAKKRKADDTDSDNPKPAKKGKGVAAIRATEPEEEDDDLPRIYELDSEEDYF